YRPANLTNSSNNPAPLILFWGDDDTDFDPMRAVADAGRFVVALALTHSSIYAPSIYIPQAINGTSTCGVSGTVRCSDTPRANGILNAVECSGAAPCQNIDTNRVYTMGGSKGGGMTLDMMCDPNIAGRFKGFVALSTSLSVFDTTKNPASVNCSYINA